MKKDQFSILNVDEKAKKDYSQFFSNFIGLFKI